ncbi:galactose mutarotase [Candidatus Sumerlaeota bacterium]|nr:galactose mutarotase [Candidatus Sumerlaeota bacterium]
MRTSVRAIGYTVVLLLLAMPLVMAAKSGKKGGKAMKGSITKTDFGKMPDGTPVDLYTLTNAQGMTAKIITYGTIITDLRVPDRAGKMGDVVMGYDRLDGYLAEHPYFGCTVGRVANRIGGARFVLDGKEYKLFANNANNALHGGKKGFDKVVWKAERQRSAEGPGVKFSYVSPDGEEGYPGNLSATVTMTVTENNALKIEYAATTDKPTPVNLTNHTYFNLGGPESGNILGHVLELPAKKYTVSDDQLIPTGEIKDVAGTPFDFTKPTEIGARIGQVTGGYDLNYVLDNLDGQLVLAARVRDTKSGRIMEMQTTEPGVQFYTGNFLDGKLVGKGGVRYEKHQGFCLEAQHYPDAVNKPNFPSVILRPGQTYKQTTIYSFRTSD